MLRVIMFQSKRIRNFTLGVCLLLSAPFVGAAVSDNQQPLHITSDTFNLNYQSGIATYNGHVLVIQGSRQLSGDQLLIERNPSGQVSKITLYGKPAKFTGLAEPNKPLVHAQALTMVYEPLKNLFTLEHDALIEQNGNISKAPKIIYNTKTEDVSTVQSQDARSTMIIQPSNLQQ